MESHIEYQMAIRSDEPDGGGWSSPAEARPTANTHTGGEDMEHVLGWLSSRVSLAIVRDLWRLHY